MILFLGKEKYEGSMQSQKYSRRSIWGHSLSKMLLHFRLDLRPWFLGNGLLVKSIWYFQNLLDGFRIFATVNWKNVSVSYTTYLKPLSLIQKRSPNTSSQEHTNAHCLYSWNTWQILSFWCFQGGIEGYHDFIWVRN